MCVVERCFWIGAACCVAAIVAAGCTHADSGGSNNAAAGAASAAAAENRLEQPGISGEPGIAGKQGPYSGFDRNAYPGEAIMARMHSTFAFTGYWITNPPGETSNSWAGKRAVLRQQGWGFLVLANGRLDAEILKAQKGSAARAAMPPVELARRDAATAVAAARSESFPPHTILFLDQEEGGRLLDEQAAYLLAWTEAVAGSAFRPGVYASGQPVPDGPGKTITTIDDIRAHVAAGHLHPIAIFDAQDGCPPSPGCVVQPHPLASSGEPDLTVWQYSQSPRRPEITGSCAKTYAADGNCYAPGFPGIFLDSDAAASADPSAGR